MLTKKQLEKIQEIIRKRFLVFTYEALGEKALTEVEVRELRALGIVRGNVKHLVDDGLTIGKLVAMLPAGSARTLTYTQVMRMATTKPLHVPTTEVERAASAWASAHAGTYIKGIGGDMVKDVTAASTRTALQTVRETVSNAVINRETRSQLKTALFAAIDNKKRDWYRVAHTELNDAIQNGIFSEIRDNSKSGLDQLVYKRPNPDGCKHCKRIFLKSDGITPRVFRLRDLSPGNHGLRVADWQPTVGSLHPWCQCQLMPILEGFDFVKKHVCLEPFDHGGKKYRRGVVVPESEYNALPAAEKAKCGVDAILQHTGRTAEPDNDLARSLNNEMISENGDDDHCCDY